MLVNCSDTYVGYVGVFWVGLYKFGVKEIFTNITVNTVSLFTDGILNMFVTKGWLGG